MEKDKNLLCGFKKEMIILLNNSKNFIKKCKKPTKSEAVALIKGHLFGMILLGLFGYVIKLIHLPINNIIVGETSV